MRYDIVGPKEKVYGKLRFWFIDVETIRTSFYAEMDVPSRVFLLLPSYTNLGLTRCLGPPTEECMRFAFTLFDRNGYLKSDFRREGSRAWGTEVKQSSIAYLDEIEIIRDERGKGIGTWAMKQIWKTVEHLDVRSISPLEDARSSTPSSKLGDTPSSAHSPKLTVLRPRRSKASKISSSSSPFQPRYPLTTRTTTVPKSLRKRS